MCKEGETEEGKPTLGLWVSKCLVLKLRDKDIDFFKIAQCPLQSLHVLPRECIFQLDSHSAYLLYLGMFVTAMSLFSCSGSLPYFFFLKTTFVILMGFWK